MTIKNFRASFFLFLFAGLTALINKPAAATLIAINDLTALTDTSATPGQIKLMWTSPAGAPTRYEIRYRLFNSPADLLDPTSWTAAGVNIFPNPPNPAAVGSPEQVLIYGLIPGQGYAFAIKTQDANNFFSPISNSTAATASTPCSGINDGKGIASVTPNTSFQNGVITPTTMTFITPLVGIQQGGRISLRVPDFWAYPNINTPNLSGYVSVFSTSTATLNLTTNGQEVVVDVVNGQLNPQEKVAIYYAADTYCSFNSQAFFRVFSQYSYCGTMKEVTVSTKTIVPGTASNIDFLNYGQVFLTNAITPVVLVARDQCWRPTTVGANTNVSLSMVKWNNSTYVYDVDPDLTLSLNSGFTSPFNSGTIVIPNGSSSATFYYQISTVDFEDQKIIQLQHAPLPPSTFSGNRNNYVTNISAGLTGVSIDNGAITANQTSTSFSPDNDGVNDMVFVNFTLPNPLNWTVEFSKDNFATITKIIYGYGQNNRASWDGFTDWLNGIPPAIATPGSYSVRISLNGNNLPHPALTATLTANGISGSVIDSNTTNPIAQCDINVFGPTSRYVQSRADGTFDIIGLPPGTYTLNIFKPGYDYKQLSVTVSNGVATPSENPILMSRPSVMRILVSRPASANLPDLYGSISADSLDGTKHQWGNLHFSVGSVDSDAGDTWNVTPTTFTTMNLVPTVTYNFHVFLPGFVIPDFTDALLLNEAKDKIIALSGTDQQKNISGKLTLPNPNSNSYPTWISIEAGIDENLDGAFDDPDFSHRFYSGSQVYQGGTDGYYTLFGVANGTYTLVARIPGYQTSKLTDVRVSGSDLSNVDFNSITTGGVLVGTMTVEGDSTSLGSPFFVPINAWSPSTFNGSFQQVTLQSDVVTTSNTYSLTGLDDGSYQVYAHIQGYEIERAPNQPPGPINVTILNGSGTLDIKFKKFSGSLSGVITLPNGNTDFSNVSVELQSFNFQFGGTVNATPDVSGNYSFSGLGTDFYSVRAYYSTTGLIVEKSIQIKNGAAVVLDLDMSGTTYSISGRLTSSASFPFDSLAYIVNSSTPTSLFTNFNSTQSPANRIVAKKLQGRDFNGGAGTYISPSFYDPRTTFFGFYDATTGNYVIDKLSPGVYQVFNNGEMDNDFTNGDEVAKIKKTINVVNADKIDVDFDLSDGYNVSGSLRVISGDVETGRDLNVLLIDKNGTTISQNYVHLAGTSVSFTLNKIPSGSYVLTAQDNFFPQKYSAKDLSIDITGADVSNQEIKLLQASKIQGQLRVKTSGELITYFNFDKLLPSGFSIEARSNPWFPGGFGFANYPLISTSTGKFLITANPGTYDIILKSQFAIGQGDIAKGVKQFVPITLSGIEISAGQTKDLGIIDLVEGTVVKGNITDLNGTALSNIRVTARPSGKKREDALEAFTDENGNYTLYGIDSQTLRYYDIVAAPRPENHDTRYQFGFSGATYGEVKKLQLDTQTTSQVNFKLQLANSIITGTVVTEDNGPLINPFEDNEIPGAKVILNKQGNIPTNNPLGDIEENTAANGSFAIKGLTPGSYDMFVLAQGYASAIKKNINVAAASTTDSGISTVTVGFKLSGTILKSDGSIPSSADIRDVIGVRNGFEEILIGILDKDASGNIRGYTISGFQTGKAYNIIVLTNNDELNAVASGVTLTQDTVQNLILQDIKPIILTQTRKATNGTDINIQFEFTHSLRNSSTDLDANGEADDSEADKIITKKTGAASGALTFDSTWLSSDRKRAVATYTPAAGETTFTLVVTATFTSIDAATGLNNTRKDEFIYFVGIGNQKSKHILNANGGEVSLENDPSKFSTQAGTFQSTGTADSTSLEGNVILRAADDATTLDGVGSSSFKGSRAMAKAEKLGYKSYPSEMSAAMAKVKASSIDPLSSFYDIFLPAGVSHFFPQGKEAQICLKYDSSATDPAALNIYYYNSATGEYVIESHNKSVDTDNTLICASISHASVFTILASSSSIISGSGYTGDLSVLNFPNPFDLKSKTLTLQNPGSSSASQVIQGTMIKFDVPPSMSGTVDIQIFNVLGEKVRSLATSASGGTYNYIEWDGTNDHGTKVASGTYIGRFTIGGSNERFFKMAVRK